MRYTSNNVKTADQPFVFRTRVILAQPSILNNIPSFKFLSFFKFSKNRKANHCPNVMPAVQTILMFVGRLRRCFYNNYNSIHWCLDSTFIEFSGSLLDFAYPSALQY